MGKEIIWEQRDNSLVVRFDRFWRKSRVFWVMLFFANLYIALVPMPSTDLFYILFVVAGLIGALNFPRWLKNV